MRLQTCFFSLCLILLAAGCGYKFSGSGTLPAGVENLYVNTFANRSSESAWETHLANALITDLSKSGIRTVSSETLAASFLQGRIQSITFDTLGSAAGSAASEVRMQVTFDVSITGKTQGLLWEKKGLRRSVVYSSADSSGKNNALQELAEDCSDYIISLLTEDF